MSTQDKSRELASKTRLEEENRQESMVSRAIETGMSRDVTLEEKAREILVETRQQVQNLQENMLERTEGEIGD
jgi:hypothetical protein